MAVYLDSYGLNGMFVQITSANQFSSPIGGIVYNLNWYGATLGGSYDSFGKSGITLNTSNPSHYNIHIRRDTQNSTTGIDSYGLRGFSSSNPKIGQYVIKTASGTIKGGTYRGVERYSGSYGLVNNVSDSYISGYAGLFYRYA